MKVFKLGMLLGMFIVGACRTVPTITLEESLASFQGGWLTAGGTYTFSGLKLLGPKGTELGTAANMNVVNGKEYAFYDLPTDVAPYFVQCFRVEGDTMYTIFDIGSQLGKPTGEYSKEEVFGTRI